MRGEGTLDMPWVGFGKEGMEMGFMGKVLVGVVRVSRFSGDLRSAFIYIYNRAS